jgi:hypothetical protein
LIYHTPVTHVLPMPSPPLHSGCARSTEAQPHQKHPKAPNSRSYLDRESRYTRVYGTFRQRNRSSKIKRRETRADSRGRLPIGPRRRIPELTHSAEQSPMLVFFPSRWMQLQTPRDCPKSCAGSLLHIILVGAEHHLLPGSALRWLSLGRTCSSHTG